MGITIEVSDYDAASALDQAVRDAIQAKVNGLNDKIEESMAEAVDARLKSLSDDALRGMFEKVLHEGWQLTNSYGEPNGRKVTLESRVREFLMGKPNDYNDPMTTVFRESLTKALQGEMGLLIKEATEKLRAQLDGSIQEKLRAAVTSAFK